MGVRLACFRQLEPVAASEMIRKLPCGKEFLGEPSHSRNIAAVNGKRIKEALTLNI